MIDIKKKIQAIVNFGIPIAVIARRVDKNTTTLGKWLRGESNISTKLEKQLIELIYQLNMEWENIINGDDKYG